MPINANQNIQEWLSQCQSRLENRIHRLEQSVLGKYSQNGMVQANAVLIEISKEYARDGRTLLDEIICEIKRILPLLDLTVGEVQTNITESSKSVMDGYINLSANYLRNRKKSGYSNFPMNAFEQEVDKLASYLKREFEMEMELLWNSVIKENKLSFSNADLLSQDLINKGESDTVEFKSSMRWDLELEKENKILKEIVIKTVASFLNTKTGGTLFIGVNDKGEIIGLENDYQLCKNNNADGFLLYLIDSLFMEINKTLSQFIHPDIETIEGMEICRIDCYPANIPTWIKNSAKEEELYLRIGNSTRKLNSREILEYSKGRGW